MIRPFPLLVGTCELPPASLIHALSKRCAFVTEPRQAAASLSFQRDVIVLPASRPRLTYEFEAETTSLSVWQTYPTVDLCAPFLVLDGLTDDRKAVQLINAIEQVSCGKYAHSYVYEVYDALA